jgi:hypothetical protein
VFTDNPYDTNEQEKQPMTKEDPTSTVATYATSKKKRKQLVPNSEIKDAY